MNRARSLKTVVARGAINNLVFAGGGSLLTYLQAISVMRIVGPEQIGLFAIGSAVALTMESISDFGIGDRLVQEDGRRLQQTYDCAVALHFVLAVALWALVWWGASPIARAYGHAELRPLIRGMSFAAFTGFLRLPLSLLTRELKYFEQRLLMFLGRAAGFLVTIGCAVGGLGVWSLVIGGLATMLVTGVPAWFMAPLRFSGQWKVSDIIPTLQFSSPVWFAKVTYVLVQQGGVLVLSVFLPLSVLGQFKSSEQIASIVLYIEVVLGQTLYPALCRLRGSPARMAGLFSKSARVSMSWIAGGAVGLIVFAPDVVKVVLSEKWAGAELFVRAQGLALLFGALIYNWDVLFKAMNNTRAIFGMSLAFGLIFVFCFIPPIYLGGKSGAAVGLVLANAMTLLSRKICVDRLNLDISLFGIAWRAVLSGTVAAFAAVAVRTGLIVESAGVRLLLELAAYLVVYVGVLVWLEQDLIVEMLDVFRMKGAAVAPTRLPSKVQA